MLREELVRRVGRLAQAQQVAVPDDYDPTDDRAVEAVAGDLLQVFRQHDDPAAFTLLFELCQRRLMASARAITRRLGMAIDPEDIVSTFMAKLFTDLRRDQPRVRRFLGLAYTAMRNEALNQLRKLKRAESRHQVYDRWLRRHRLPPDPAGDVAAAEQHAILRRLGAMFLSVVSVCFHQLGERDRRVLLAREVDGLSYDAIAEQLGLPRPQVGMILKRARERLAKKIAATFDGVGRGTALPDDADARPGGRRGHRVGEEPPREDDGADRGEDRTGEDGEAAS